MKKVGHRKVLGIFVIVIFMIGFSNYVLASNASNKIKSKKNQELIAEINSESSLEKSSLESMTWMASQSEVKETKKANLRSSFPFPRRSFFFNANLAIFVFQEVTTSVETLFPAYGEEGSITQNIRTSSPLGLEINAGKYIPLGKIKLKVGLGMNSFPLKTTGSFKLSVPHPYLSSSPRHYYFSEEFKNSSLHFYGFAYLVPFESWRLQFSVGPVIGYSTGKYPGLEDLEIEDKSPFRWSDLDIKSKTYKIDSFSTLSFGGAFNIALFLIENMSFQFSYKFQSLKPQIDVLKDKVNLSFSRLMFCVEFAF